METAKDLPELEPLESLGFLGLSAPEEAAALWEPRQELAGAEVDVSLSHQGSSEGHSLSGEPELRFLKSF